MKIPTTTPYGGVVLGPLDDPAKDLPRGCFVYVDSAGAEWVVFGPQVVQQMRDDCPICAAGGDHGAP